MRRVVAVVLLLAVLGGAQAQVYEVGNAAIRGAAATFTEAEVLQLAGLSNVSKGINWGAVVPYVGTAVFLGAAIYTVLDWFYDEAQRATGTPLDQWAEGPDVLYHVPGADYSNRAASPGCASCWPQPANVSVIFAAVDAIPGLGNAYGGVWVLSSMDPAYPAIGSAAVRSSTSQTISGTSTSAYNASWSQGAAEYGSDCVLQNYLDDQLGAGIALVDGGNGLACRAEPQPTDLYDFLQANPSAIPGVKTAVGDFLENEAVTGAMPDTFPEPVDGFTQLTPTPTDTQYADNPWVNTSTDTDGDGYEDWKEAVAGTNPVDPNSYPTVDPADPDGDPLTDPLPDADADGVPDQYDPCPFDALNRCTDAPTESPDVEIPDDYAREGTLQGLAGTATDIAGEVAGMSDTLDAIADSLDAEPVGTPATPTLGTWVAPELAAGAWASVQTHAQTVVADFVTAVSPKVAFITQPWLPLVTFGSGGSCEAINMTILGEVQDVGLCNTPIHTFMASIGRAVLLAIAAVAFWLSAARLLTEGG